MMAPSIRQPLIIDALIEAVQQGQLKQSEMASTMWLLRAYDWKLPTYGMLAELQRRLIAICPLLAPESDTPAAPAPTQPAPARKPAAKPAEPMSGIRGRDYGLQPTKE